MQLKCLITVFLLADYDCHAWYCVVDQRMTLAFQAPMLMSCLRSMNEWLNNSWCRLLCWNWTPSVATIQFCWSNFRSY